MPDPLAANPQSIKASYDYIVVGAGAAGSVVAGELSKAGVEVLVIESGPADTAPTISNPSVWFYNMQSALNYALPIKPTPQINNRGLALALGHVVGGGSSINAMVWTRGMERDYDAWAELGQTLGLEGCPSDFQGAGGLGRRSQRVARCRWANAYRTSAQSPSNRTRRRRGGRTNGFSYS